MGRYTGPKEKLSRREGINLFLKGSRSFSQKAGTTRKPYIPGQHGPKGSKVKTSNFGTQLREKQKVKRIYGVREKQFRNIYIEATRLSKVYNSDRGLEMLRLLETRLDNVVYLLGLAPSRSAARQYITHRHIQLNGKTFNIPSYNVSKEDVISIKKEALVPLEVQVKTPSWLGKEKLQGKVLEMPIRDQIDEGIKENLIVEFYSR